MNRCQAQIFLQEIIKEHDSSHYSHYLKKNIKLHKFLKSKYGDKPLNQLFYMGLNLMKPKDSICPLGKERTFKTIIKGFMPFCGTGSKCECNRKFTGKCSEEHYASLTNEEKEERIQNYKDTCIEKYGVDNVQKDPKIQEKGIQTRLEKYGCKYMTEWDQFLEKSQATCMEKYGVDNVKKSPVIQEKTEHTNLERYGVENVMQYPEIFEKQLNSAHRFKSYIMPSGKEVQVQGYEPRALDYIFENKLFSEEEILIQRTKIIPIKYFDTIDQIERYYHPDLMIPNAKLILEVKSNYTFEYEFQMNMDKATGVKQLGYDIIFMIFSEKENNPKIILG